MKTITIKETEPINLKVVRFELDFTQLNPPTEKVEQKIKIIEVPKINNKQKMPRQIKIPAPPRIESLTKRRDVRDMIEELLDEIYADQRTWSTNSAAEYSQGSTTATSLTSSQTIYGEQTDAVECSYFQDLDVPDLQVQINEWQNRLQVAGERLAKCVRMRDRMRRQQKRLCAAFTVLLRHITGESGARFGVTVGGEGPGEGGYAEWLHAMRLVARLPAGVPHHFRKKLWLNLAERHLTARAIDWPVAERACFRGTAQPDDTELGAQIIKDLHRTGCSLFCGAEGRENQAMLRRVLLAYARWNKDVGYCQGFNMLAAIILEVMDKSESDSLKVMIYLVEAVLPEGYFADDLRGLSADMAAFRDLLRLRLPRLANHMDHLQRISDGGGVEPPLPDVFTMQWFLTLYTTWLPKESLLRIWDLILLDGNEVLLLTALAIWDMLQDRILSARSADEFYSCMGGGASAVWEAGEALVARVVAFDSAPELPRLRSLHRYRVAPPAPPTAAPICHPPLQTAVQSMTKRGLRLFYSEDEGDSSDDGNKMALATVIPRREERSGTGDRLSLDIGALKRQYARLRERQRQAHIILAAACARHAAVGVPTSPTSLTVNNLLLGKSAIVSSRGRRLGPPPGAIPPSRQTSSVNEKTDPLSKEISNETISWKEENIKKTINRRNSLKWKDIKKEKEMEVIRKASIDLDEAGDGVIVSELEAKQMIATLRSRSSSETSSYSSHTATSTDTSLCDENERVSDSDQDLPNDDIEKNGIIVKNNQIPTSSSVHKEICSPKKPSPSPNNIDSKQSTSDTTIKNISDYIDSAAGEPLRTYIDGFETKLKDSHFIDEKEICYKPESPFKFTPTHSSRLPSSTNESNVSDYKLSTENNETKTPLNLGKVKNFMELSPIEITASSHYYLEKSVNETKRPTNLSKSKHFTELSPIDLSPCHCTIGLKSPYEFDYNRSFKQPITPKLDLHTRPPDIIDSFTMYPNFVPDIDLTERNVSDYESPPRSPGSESIIVSEDEPPIPLKIDKYFEHSPEFFGARLTDPNNAEIPNRRSTRRNSRLPKKPDSLTLQTNQNEKILVDDMERSSSLPQDHSSTKNNLTSPITKNESNINITPKYHDNIAENTDVQEQLTGKKSEKSRSDAWSPKDYILCSGRKNSEKALQIIQENSQILSRILTKQNINNSNTLIAEENKSEEAKNKQQNNDVPPLKTMESKLIESPLLKESTSDSLIGCIKRKPKDDSGDKNHFLRARPISIDDPFSFEARNNATKNEFSMKTIKTPSTECIANKTDLYGWENKGFLAKCEFAGYLQKPEKKNDEDYHRKVSDVRLRSEIFNSDLKPSVIEWTRYSFSGESKTSVTLASSEVKDSSSYDRRITSDDYNYPLSTSSKYNDFILSRASDICSKIAAQGPKICENVLKTDTNSQMSDFSHRVTSSISLTCEPSVEDDSPTGAKSNSSDTLCQITSLDQVSTPISPKIFPTRETPTLPKDYTDKSDRIKIESDDTCSAITSLIETDTLSSLSYPRSPSTGSYHPFPTRPAIRLPKDLGVRLGMYPKETVNSPPK